MYIALWATHVADVQLIARKFAVDIFRCTSYIALWFNSATHWPAKSRDSVDQWAVLQCTSYNQQIYVLECVESHRLRSIDRRGPTLATCHCSIQEHTTVKFPYVMSPARPHENDNDEICESRTHDI